MDLILKRELPEIEGDGDRNRDHRRLKLEPSSSKSLQETYKDEVLKLLGDKNQSNVLTCELRMFLFVAAVKYPFRDDKRIHPFPPCFLNKETMVRDYTGLTSTIDKIPAFATINESTQLSDLIWEFLHWVLINPVISLEPLITDIDISTEIRKLKQTTGLQNLQTPDNSKYFIFKITQTNPNPAFEAGKKKYGSVFAFHGSAIWNFHSIIHRGLMCSFNVRMEYGYGTYMVEDFWTSMYNAHMLGPHSVGWAHGLFGISFACIAIVEFVNCPSYSKYKNNYSLYLCDEDEHMRLSHLYVIRR